MVHNENSQISDSVNTINPDKIMNSLFLNIIQSGVIATSVVIFGWSIRSRRIG